MTKEFIPYQEALEMKKLGFDEPCICFYHKDKKQIQWYDKQSTSIFINSGTPAPLYQQAFRWFREKYRMDIHIKGTYFRSFWVIGIAKEIIPQSIDGYPLVTKWDYITPDGTKVLTYEEAELDCLKKLIEIVKK